MNSFSNNNNDVFIIECVRTPIGRGYSNGSLHNIQPVDLLALTLNELMKKSGISKSEVEDVITGCVTPIGEQGGNIGRIALLKAGFPEQVPSVQLNRMCGSGQQAIHFASQAIASGDMDCVIACGIEMMGRVTMGSDWIWTDKEKKDDYSKGLPYKLLHQGESAELMADKWNITREEMDNLSILSHERCANAIQKGYFKREIFPIKITKPDNSVTIFDKDEGVRFPVDKVKLTSLKPIFRTNGRVTAANSSQVSDGASAILLVSAKKLKLLNLHPKARIISRVVVGSHPELMLSGPIPATKKALEKSGLTIDQIDVIEINEAFASVVLAWIKEMKPPHQSLEEFLKKVNPNGGAIAHGHPLGASGCILMTKLVHELERTGKKYGLQTMCIGFGMATDRKSVV